MDSASRLDSFDSSLTQCYGNAENRFLKRVGTKITTMKKICLLLAGIAITGCFASSQTLGPCPLKDKVRQVVRAADSMSGLFRNMQESLTSATWNNFEIAVRNYAGLSAFNSCGPRGEEFAGIYTTVGKELGASFNSLIAAIDPGGRMGADDLLHKMDDEFKCYFDDPANSNFQYVRMMLNGPGGSEKAAGGPCERAARTCCNDANRNYHAALRQCVSTGAGIGGLISGWLGAGVGLFCAVVASNDQWHDFRVCIANYEDCLEKQ